MRKYICIFLLMTGSLSYAQQPNLFSKKIVEPRIRVIIDNDFSGDPDGLFQLVHQLLSPSVQIEGIIGSHLKPKDGFDPSTSTATNAKKRVEEILKIMHIKKIPVYAGSNTGLTSIDKAKLSDASDAIIKEAMNDDKRPLYILCGAGLTDLASAYLLEPKIASRLTLIWIGGSEYPDIALPPPGYSSLEYNLGIDIKAGQVIFNKSNIPIWQIPRSTYRQAIIPYSELLLKVKSQGVIGTYLTDKIESVMKMCQKININIGETYIVGDSPLVLLTALQSSFESDPSSSTFIVKQTPIINDKGLYEYNGSGRNIRVYTYIDNRLMLEDFFSKLQLFKDYCKIKHTD